MPGLASNGEKAANGSHPRLRVIICGAGLGGLGAAIGLARKGHEVVVLEGASQLSEVGAGIQIPPNSMRVLDAYGLSEKLQQWVQRPKNIALRRYATGQILGVTPLHPRLTETYGFPYLLIHRADYQRILHEEAKSLGVDVHMSTRVVSVNTEAPLVTTETGQQYTGDVIVGADGIRSKVREFVIPGQQIEPSSSSNCAFRATVPSDDMLSDPEVAHLMSDVNANSWIGHKRHVMAYPIRQGAMYNLVMSHPGQAAPGKWNEPGNLDEMKAIFDDFDPVLKRVLGKVKGCLKWKLADLPPLPKWVSESGRVILIGDAAHAMVPYLAQGASMAIEDGAALAECLSRVQSRDEISRYLGVFESVRKSRCERIQEGSRINGETWHMPDGPQQEARDKALGKDHTQEKPTRTNGEASHPNLWSDKGFQPWLFGHDVFAETVAALDRAGQSKPS